MQAGELVVNGTVAAGFEPVREAFERNFTDHEELGAAFALVHDGRLVADLWAGWADKDCTRPWAADTIVNVYSTTKGLAALCGHMLADRGLLDFDAPVREYWPEFAQAGKQDMPVRYLFTHEAGLPVIDEPLGTNAVVDWETMVGALERQAPVWEPGSTQGYHAVTFGWLVGEVVRRVTKAPSVGTFLAEEVVRPLGVDCFIGTPVSEHGRIADLVQDTTTSSSGSGRGLMSMFPPDSLAARALGIAAPPRSPGANSPEWRAAEVPAANGHTNARALATIYGALSRGGELGGVRLLTPEAISRAAKEQVRGPDAVLTMETRRSLGYMLPVHEQGDRRGAAAFGHAGAGGSLGYADPERAFGFGYTMNRMWPAAKALTDPDPRAQNLVAAVHQALSA